jgi:hypothetical protein
VAAAPQNTEPPASEQPKQRSYTQKLWVPFLVLIGLALGELISYFTSEPSEYITFGSGPMGFYFPHLQSDPLLQFHVVLTTVEVVLLVSLVVIYIRMYAQTRANFSLGLVVVLVALLVEALLSYPLIIGYYGPVSLEPGLSSPSADIFTVCAYAVFLYLSLE